MVPLLWKMLRAFLAITQRERKRGGITCARKCNTPQTMVLPAARGFRTRPGPATGCASGATARRGWPWCLQWPVTRLERRGIIGTRDTTCLKRKHVEKSLYCWGGGGAGRFSSRSTVGGVEGQGGFLGVGIISPFSFTYTHATSVSPRCRFLRVHHNVYFWLNR
jgi:hypothetical protein